MTARMAVPIAAAVLAASAAAAAQGLGEAARRAQELRQATAGKGIRIEIVQGGRPISPVKLDRQVVEHYVNARIAMAKLWHRDPMLYRRVHAAVQTARTLGELAEALTAERPVAELLALYDYTPEVFYATELTLVASEARLDGGFDMSALSDVEKENHEFMGRHFVWVSLMRGRIGKAEEGMSIWE